MLYYGPEISDVNFPVAAPSFSRIEIEFQSIGARISPGSPQEFSVVQRTNLASDPFFRSPSPLRP